MSREHLSGGLGCPASSLSWNSFNNQARALQTLQGKCELATKGIETQPGQGLVSRGFIFAFAAGMFFLKFDEAANAFYEGVKLEPENMELVNAFRNEQDQATKAVVATASGNSRTRSFPSKLRTLFGEEIVDPKTREETPVTISVDDGICPGTTLADLAKLKLVFKKDDSTTYITKLSSLPTSGISLLNNLCNGFL
ncbi:3-ketoacyl-CoA thiolase 2, peroxisomal [Tanacetum coccineum]|uniref:3-ketoacyl-CoA thiolase 2, peroxisomal n=1 Tax=Tanacetum coccineum TaxID=301880 RepID=A0ABQ5G5P3_9ASTR